MKRDAAVAIFLSLLLASGVSRVANAHAAEGTSGASESAATGSIPVDSKAARKISLAIGEDVDDFVVIAQEQVESSAGTNATQYTVRTNGGRHYKCQIIEPSRAGKFFSFGTASGADALCTQFAAQSGNGQVVGTGHAEKRNAEAGPPTTGAITISDKARKKISMAIGEETDRFAVTKQEDVESSVGMKGTEYTVRTDGGKTYKCQILEPSKLGKLVTFGTAGGADALCTDFTKGSKDQGKTNQANCNALLRAAHKCD